MLIISALIVAAFTDIRSRRIPNVLTYSATLIGISHHMVIAGFDGFLVSIGGLAVGLGVLLPFYIMGGMGAGDVKLMGAVGAFLGPKAVFVAFLFTALAGGIYALLLFAIHGRFRETLFRYAMMGKMALVGHKLMYIPAPPEPAGKPKLRYAVAIAVGTIASFFVKFI